MRVAVLVSLSLLPVLFAAPPTIPAAAPGGSPLLSEIVADPQTDWNGDGKLTSSDELVELENMGPADFPLDGWAVLFNDTTPATLGLSGTLAAHERRAWINPPGEVNNNAHVALLRPDGTVADELRYGSWTGNTAGIPDARSTGPGDEALRRVDGVWTRGHATPGGPNDEPWMELRLGFDGPGGEWDPGNRTRNWSLRLVDADRSYGSARAELRTAGGTTESAAPLVTTAGVGSANGTITTPRQDFDVRLAAVDAQGAPHATPWRSVHVDANPPPVPDLIAPEWTRDGHVQPEASPVTDAGVGGVEYLFESAPDSPGPWAPLAAWSASTRTSDVTVPGDQAVWLRVRARDAYAHESAPSPVRTVRTDDRPPTPPIPGPARGTTVLHLEWIAPRDDESGVDAVLLERVQPSPAQWRLPALATSLDDDHWQGRAPPEYRLWAVDRAGNPSEIVLLKPRFEGLQPHAQLRLNRPWWGPGTLLVHADFDRPMDVTTPAQLALRTSDGDAPLNGTWLSNRTSYSARLSDSEEFPSGPAQLVLRAALASNGEPLPAPRFLPLVIDHDPPQVEFQPPAPGWINATGLLLRATDALDPAPALSLRVRAPGADATETHDAPNGVFLLAPPGASFQVWAEARDRAGNRAPAVRARFQVDDAPPRLDGLRWMPNGTLAASFSDNASGVDAPSLEVQGAILVASQGKLHGATAFLRVPEPNHPLTLRISDAAGNWLSITSPLPARPTPSAVPRQVGQEAAAEGAGAPHAKSFLPVTPVGPLDVPPVAWPAMAACLVLAGFLVQRVRRRRPQASLAGRLRALREADVEAAIVRA